ncbi:putative disease resistance protein At3g14460 [Ziziphus jujuba]|uniref:Disease resistance protein At3g14460 n=1 Tax=Ziziphus jujuba TaxID=326968 RepID=A0ABM4A176_ZIZJJ|nr:putative disease resistance protein At3g14460 [Ziziphus jujuba]
MVVLGEIFLGAFLRVLLQKLMSKEVLDFARGGRVHKKLKKWSSTLETIKAVLSDAEEKQLTDEAVKLWLGDLRDLAYDVEDVLDKFYTELLRREVENLYRASASKVWSLIPTCCTSSTPSALGLFMFKMDSEINKITVRLQDITQRKNDLGLNAIERSVIEWKRPPSSSLPDGQVIGRDEHKKKIVQLLLTDQQSNLNFDVVGIVGMPGVGKTTLAGLVFHDDAVKEHFDIRVWISVSVEFDYVRLTKAILQTIKPESANNEEFSKLQERLSEELTGKKFLFVLDDVWNTKNDLHDLWVTMRPPFRAGAPGSKIIVTTRDESAAKLMGAVGHHNLDCVSRDDWWKIFVEHAFSTSNTSEQQNLGSLRDEILAKCDGLPLSARALGGLLCYKEVDGWKEVLENKLWTQPEHSNIPSLLKLSYHYLPPHVKRCFAYCSIFPEDYEFEEKQLILLWMAEGLLQNPKGSRQMEDLGREYFRELSSRSFFQKSKKDESKYVMHDLFNELARSVAGEIGFRLEDKVDNDKRCRSFEKFRHSAYFSSEPEGMQRLEVFSNLEHLRTFLPLSHSYHERRKYLTSNFTREILPKLQYLRVLSLNGYCIRELPDSIGELKFLRYLDLSHTDITTLPESISHLYNLQTLLLEGCYYLNALPSGLKNLISLRHLTFPHKLPHRGPLKGMPSNMGKLTNLRTLSYFEVGKESSSSGIGELGPLLHLRRTLHISGLENVNGVEDAAMANLTGKDGIDVLVLEWKSGETADPDIFESLQPPRMLKELIVMGYGGSKFPDWMGNALFSKMVKMRLDNCRRCKLLPSLGQLSLLKELTINGLSGVESVGSEFYGDGGLNAFPLLETLCFKYMENWKDWFPDETNNGIDRFPQLKKLVVNNCPMLKGKLPENLPSLKDLEVFACERLTVSIPSNQMLCSLSIRSCAEVVCENHAHLKSLKSIFISNIRKFRYQPERFMQGLTREENLVVPGCNEMAALLQDTFCQLTSFRELRIEGSSLRHLTLVAVPGCNWMTSLQQYELRQLASRRCLKINDSCLQYLELDVEETEQVQLRITTKLERLLLSQCNNLLKVPEGLHLTLLKELSIVLCHSLTSISESSLPSSLRVLYIRDCSNLKSVLVQEEYTSTNSNCTLCLESLTIQRCFSLESLTSAKLPDTLKQLEVWDCPSLICLSSSKELPEALVLDISTCNRLTSLLSDDKLPKALKRLKISECQSLTCLSSSEELLEALEDLNIRNCNRLTSLVSDDKFPKALKHLTIWGCGKLKRITNRFYSNTCLQSLSISNCKNLTSLPEGLHHLTDLRAVYIVGCENLVSFPEGGLPASNLRRLIAPGTILNNMVANPRGMQGFPPNLTSLTILNLEVIKPLFQLGLLHRLTSLRELDLKGKATDMVSFPSEDEKGGRKGMMLPKSLITLRIQHFENLKKFSAGLQCLTSLQHVYLINCEKLKSLPERGLLRSLLKLEISGCKLLQKKCKRDTGPFWPRIAHIPDVRC